MLRDACTVKYTGRTKIVQPQFQSRRAIELNATFDRELFLSPALRRARIQSPHKRGDWRGLTTRPSQKRVREDHGAEQDRGRAEHGAQAGEDLGRRFEKAPRCVSTGTAKTGTAKSSTAKSLKLLYLLL